MTRCGEFYKLFEDEVKSCSVTHQCLERALRVKTRRIKAYLWLRDLFGSQGVPESSFYCLFAETAARPLWGERDGNARDSAIEKIKERCLNNERTTSRDTMMLIQEAREYEALRVSL